MNLFKRRRHIADPYTCNERAMMPCYASPPLRNTTEWMETFGSNPRLAPVEKIAGDLSYAAGKLYRVADDGTRIEVTSHPFLDFMKMPNPLPEFTASALWKLFQEYLLLKGEAYFIIERYEDGTPAELWPVPVQWVQQTPYVGAPYYTVRVTGGGVMHVPIEDMFAMKDLNPVDPYRRGLGQAEALADEVELDEYAAKFQKEFFYNGATPDTAVILPGADEKQVNRFREKWAERFKGIRKSHGVAVLSGPREGAQPAILKLSDNMKDMDMINGRTFTRDAIMEHFGMPREIMGITQNSNRATADAAQYIYATNILRPRIRQREDAINLQIVPFWGDDLLWVYDDIIPKDAEYSRSVAMEGWNNGLITRNAALELLGQESSERGNIFKINFADMFVDADENLVELSSRMANMQYAEQPELLEEDRNEIEVVPDEEETILRKAAEMKAGRESAAGRSLETVRRAQNRKFETATLKYFRGQSERAASALNGVQKDRGDIWDKIGLTPEEFVSMPEAERRRTVEEFAENILDWEAEEGLLQKLMAPLWTETYSKGAENTQQLYRLNGVRQPALTSTAKLRGGQRITRVTQTTRSNVARIVADGLSQGINRQELTQQIVREMNTSDERARVIAAQECNTSLLTGSFDMAKAGGFEYKTWHVTNIGKARDTHLALNGKTVRIDEPFITPRGIKLMNPCDPDCNVPEETVNCHCFLTYS